MFASGRPARTRLLTERLSHSHVTPQQKQDRNEAKLESVSLFGLRVGVRVGWREGGEGDEGAARGRSRGCK